MFAIRFDPTRITKKVEEDVNKTKLIPAKRSSQESEDNATDESENEADHENENKTETKNKNEFDRSGMSDVKCSDLSKVSKNQVNSEHIAEKHSSVLSRFQQTIEVQHHTVPNNALNLSTDDILTDNSHDLLPIPQPSIVKDVDKPTVSKIGHNSTVWINTTKIFYNNTMIKPFNYYEGKINKNLLSNIISKFSSNTFPVQTILLDTILEKLNFVQSISKKNYTRRIGDILVNASTGSGKTLAYAIPVLQVLSSRTVNKLRAIIIVPTRVLIHQVYETILLLSKGTSLLIGISKLDNSLKDEHAKFQHEEPDILIITPGRLVDHLNMSSFTLKNLKFLILDEADRLLNQYFQNWCNELVERLANEKLDKKPGNVIKMVFSATLTTNTEKLHSLQLHDPKLFLKDSVKMYNLPKKLQEFNIYIPTSKNFAKPLFLLRLIDQISDHLKVLVFVKSNESSMRLSHLMNIMIKNNMGKNNISISSINSNNSKGINKKLIHSFSESFDNNKHVLISTDLISRGIDISNITHIINYDLPMSSQQYVHRCGRTARAGADGIAINMLVGKGERKFWENQIDIDLSRDIDGCQPKTFENYQSTSDDLSGLIGLDDSVRSVYKKSLEQLQQDVLRK